MIYAFEFLLTLHHWIIIIVYLKFYYLFYFYLSSPTHPPTHPHLFLATDLLVFFTIRNIQNRARLGQLLKIMNFIPPSWLLHSSIYFQSFYARYFLSILRRVIVRLSIFSPTGGSCDPLCISSTLLNYIYIHFCFPRNSCGNQLWTLQWKMLFTRSKAGQMTWNLLWWSSGVQRWGK